MPEHIQLYGIFHFTKCRVSLSFGKLNVLTVCDTCNIMCVISNLDLNLNNLKIPNRISGHPIHIT